MILLNTQMGIEKEALKKITAISGVTEAYSLYSIYDIAVRIYAPSMGELKDTITHKIMKIPGALSILTLITAEEEQGTIPDLQAFMNPTLVATC